MVSSDPHIHVEAGMRSRATERTMMASTFGLIAELPAEVGTPCGLRVPFAMTSDSPASVTCLPCREHAAAQHRLFADQMAAFGTAPGSPVTATDALRAAAAHRDLARRFTAPPGER